MRSTTQSLLLALAGVAVLGLVPAALGHGGGMETEPAPVEEPSPEESVILPSYFAHPEHRGVIYAHIALMTLAWVFMLPVAVMLSLARSRYTLPAQFVFLATNAVGVLFSTIYNASTPDLYPNNAHHKLGWIVTFVACAHVLVCLLGRVVGAFQGQDAVMKHSVERQAFIPLRSDAMADEAQAYRLSHDSGQGTEPNTESLRSPSLSSNDGEVSIPLRDSHKEYDEGAGRDSADDDYDNDLEAHVPPGHPHSGRMHSLAMKAATMISSRTWKLLMFAYNFVDRTILILGFIAYCLGIVAFGRLFEGHRIFTGLAHWIKGGVFFWLGILTLGRWSGCFGELGWAWNVRPKSASQKWRPSAEFVESGLIFFYGSTNIFLEHLGNWGREWSPEDLEHISITVLFIGGGLCGMLIESTRIRDLLNTTVSEAVHEYPESTYHDEEREALRPPKQYEFSINPIPALVILLLGIMMSSHTQHTMLSSMVHKQWGNLLTGASFARGLTYVIMYLKPPRSILPSRPPTELLTAFGLIAGGIIFMASSADTVEGMIRYDLDAMFFYTVTMGLVGFLMAWVILVIALKGWAVRKEAGRPVGSYRMS